MNALSAMTPAVPKGERLNEAQFPGEVGHWLGTHRLRDVIHNHRTIGVAVIHWSKRLRGPKHKSNQHLKFGERRELRC